MTVVLILVAVLAGVYLFPSVRDVMLDLVSAAVINLDWLIRRLAGLPPATPAGTPGWLGRAYSWAQKRATTAGARARRLASGLLWILAILTILTVAGIYAGATTFLGVIFAVLGGVIFLFFRAFDLLGKLGSSTAPAGPATGTTTTPGWLTRQLGRFAALNQEVTRTLGIWALGLFFLALLALATPHTLPGSIGPGGIALLGLLILILSSLGALAGTGMGWFGRWAVALAAIAITASVIVPKALGWKSQPTLAAVRTGLEAYQSFSNNRLELWKTRIWGRANATKHFDLLEKPAAKMKVAKVGEPTGFYKVVGANIVPLDWNGQQVIPAGTPVAVLNPASTADTKLVGEEEMVEVALPGPRGDFVDGLKGWIAVRRLDFQDPIPTQRRSQPQQAPQPVSNSPAPPGAQTPSQAWKWMGHLDLLPGQELSRSDMVVDRGNRLLFDTHTDQLSGRVGNQYFLLNKEKTMIVAVETGLLALKNHGNSPARVTFWNYGAQDVPAAALGSARREITFWIDNQGGQDVAIKWVEPSGNRFTYLVVPPGRKLPQNSYTDTVWEAWRGHQLLRTIVNPTAEQVVEIH